MKLDYSIINNIITILIGASAVSILLRINQWAFKRIQKVRTGVQIVFLKRLIAAASTFADRSLRF